MPARIVIAHDDAKFVEDTSKALRDAGYDVAGFTDSMAALRALEVAQRVEVLVTRVVFPEGQPHGVALGLMARAKRPGIRVLFVAQPYTRKHTEGVGEFLPAGASASEIVAVVQQIILHSEFTPGQL